MQYLLLIYDDEKRWAKGYDAEELKGYAAFAQEFKNQIVAGKALQPTKTATTVRLREGKRLATDGPFAETKEHLSGFYLVEAKDLADAQRIAARIPAAKWGSIEVRPIMKFD